MVNMENAKSLVALKPTDRLSFPIRQNRNKSDCSKFNV